MDSRVTMLVVFDIETGGLDPQQHPIIQFASIAVDEFWNPIEEMEVKIAFDENKASQEALEKNSYDSEIWRTSAIDESVARRQIAQFLSRHATIEKISKRTGEPYWVARLCGHNAAVFDGPFLMAWFKRAGVFLPADTWGVLDTMHLARWIALVSTDKPKDLKLGTLCEWLGIKTDGAHDALSDVRATVRFCARIAPRKSLRSIPAMKQ